MKKFFGLLLLLSSLSAFAQELTCLDKLLPYNRYSGVHIVMRDEWADGKETFDADSMKNAMNFLVNSKLLCKSGEMVIKVLPVCALTIADLPQSNTCFAFTNLGYFVASRDNSRNISFIFSKDKKFSEPQN